MAAQLNLVKFGCGGNLGRRSEMPDTILEGDHPRIISANFGSDWLSSFRGEDVTKMAPTAELSLT
jgi:hypothetical protein